MNTPRSFVSPLPFGGASGNDATVLDPKLPDYQLVNISAGVEFDLGLEVVAYISNSMKRRCSPLIASAAAARASASTSASRACIASPSAKASSMMLDVHYGTR